MLITRPTPCDTDNMDMLASRRAPSPAVGPSLLSATGHNVLVQRNQAREMWGDHKLGSYAFSASQRDVTRLIRAVQQLLDARGHAGYVSRCYPVSSDAIIEPVGNAADPECHHGPSSHHGFESHQAEGLRPP